MRKTARKSRPVVRLAIVGAGGMANTHAKAFQAIPGCELAAVVEIAPARRETFAKTHGISAAFAGVTELLKSAPVDAVSVVTPDAYHMRPSRSSACGQACT
ncbi:MAG TPA: Gfo/Idh/MocA family oxidoreductase [Opitutaceae bacterium]